MGSRRGCAIEEESRRRSGLSVHTHVYVLAPLTVLLTVIARLQQVHLIVDDITTQANELASVYEASLEPFSPHFDKLLGEYPKEFDRYRLDEVVVAAIAPTVSNCGLLKLTVLLYDALCVRSDVCSFNGSHWRIRLQ